MATLFSHLLVLLTLATGLVWAFDHYVLRPKRVAKVAALEANPSVELPEEKKADLLREGAIAENCHSVFPVLAIVLVLRSFLYEPFQIPSGSMMPTLLVGDFILVEKFSYGIKDPVWRKTMMETGTPERGDVAVFKYPEDTRIDYIKRIVGLPGDTVVYRNKTLYIKPACPTGEGCEPLKPVAQVEVNRGEFNQGGIALERAREALGETTHDILINPRRREPVHMYYPQAGSSNAEWVVPQGQYFAMGDNRDNSTDSRFWGFVDEELLVGKAVFIWMSFEFERGSDSWLPGWIPTGVRFGRIGGIE
ncbi:signal peptidase I [Ferrimonas marina]|uniref:Signal peptidase I n=1 Tax=Ferrimonas marina TaxID=299255 RepID=A0A1M5ZGN7_9GAMM|nr:signal peptidase I [Ferrimonas marina]SHI23301.1 signal peptidase I [Ferrimonas marina]